MGRYLLRRQFSLLTLEAIFTCPSDVVCGVHASVESRGNTNLGPQVQKEKQIDHHPPAPEEGVHE